MTKSRGIQLNRPSRDFWTGKPCLAENCAGIIHAKGYCRKHYLQTIRTGTPDRINSVSGHITKRGYRSFHVKGRGNVFEHVLIAEQALGHRLPTGAVVHHCGNKLDNRNIAIFPSQAYHLMIHMRLDALDACENADWRKCVSCGSYDSLDRISIYGGQATHKKRLYCEVAA